MTQFTSPVLHSLLDTDAYKLHMQQAVFHRYGDVHVAAEFRCRGDDLLGIYADAIREQVETMRDLKLQDDEYHWLSTLPFFSQDYLDWLRDFRYDPGQVTVNNENGKLNIRLSGPWREVIMWEVPLLAVISELVHHYRSPEISVDLALETLEHKLADFAQITAGLDLSHFRLMDFGTRRRFSREVQQAIVKGDASLKGSKAQSVTGFEICGVLQGNGQPLVHKADSVPGQIDGKKVGNRGGGCLNHMVDGVDGDVSGLIQR